MSTADAEHRYPVILVLLDGTEMQEKVLERAIDIADRNSAKLIIGHAVDSTVLETAGAYPVDLIPGLEKAFKDSIKDMVDAAEKEHPDIDIDMVVKTGRLRETIKDDMLDVYDPDLVICGARGLSPLKYALLGSISTFVVRNAKCDVMVVK